MNNLNHVNDSGPLGLWLTNQLDMHSKVQETL